VVNASIKLNVVVFRRDSRPIGFDCIFKGDTIPVVASFKFLGVTFCGKRAIRGARDMLTNQHDV
jgi:hypothetical protein